MAKSVQVKLNPAGCRAVLKSPAVLAELDKRAKAIARTANGMVSADTMNNPAFMSDKYIGVNRARANVWASSPHGLRANAKKNVLLKALGSGR